MVGTGDEASVAFGRWLKTIQYRALFIAEMPHTFGGYACVSVTLTGQPKVEPNHECARHNHRGWFGVKIITERFGKLMLRQMVSQVFAEAQPCFPSIGADN